MVIVQSSYQINVGGYYVIHKRGFAVGENRHQVIFPEHWLHTLSLDTEGKTPLRYIFGYVFRTDTHPTINLI